MKSYKEVKLIERVILVGPMNDVKKWIDWSYENDYTIIRGGPKHLSGVRYDSTRFELKLEKELSHEQQKLVRSKS